MERAIVFLVDTNILIYYLEGRQEAVDFLSRNRGSLAISSIAWMEVLSYPFTPEEESIVRSFLNEFSLIDITMPVMELAVSVRKQKKIKLPDAIIAASSMHHSMTLVTRNTKDFKGLSVQVDDPFTAAP
jgi:hypothetical protein